MKPAAFLAAFLLLASTALAQITAPERADVHTVAALKVDRTFPAGSKVKYRWSAPTLSIGEGTADNKTAYVTGGPGSHPYALTVAWIEGEALQLETFNGTLTFGDAPPVPPVVVKTLAELAGDKAAILAELLTDLREAGLPIAPTVDGLKAAFNAGLARAAVTPDHPAAVEIIKRIDAAGSGKIDDAIRKSLDAALAKAIAELGAKPPEPPVVAGKRRVLILHETADDTPADSALYIELRNGEADKYAESKGHTIDILDVSSFPSPDPSIPIPSMFIYDAATGAIINKQPRPATPAAILEALKSSGG